MSTIADTPVQSLTQAVEQRVAIEILYPGSDGLYWREIQPFRFGGRFGDVIRGICLSTEREQGMGEIPEDERPYEDRAWRGFRISDIRDWHPVTPAPVEVHPDQLELEATATDADAAAAELRNLSGTPVEIRVEAAVRVIWRVKGFAKCEAVADTLTAALADALAMERDFH